MAAHSPGAPCLVAPSERARFLAGLDLLRKAGKGVPPWLYRWGSHVPTTDAAGSTASGVSLMRLLADIARALAWFDTE
jgi:hypothetical protein